MEVTVRSDINRVLPKLEAFTSRQAPFAIAKALTSTAKLVQGEVTQQLPTAFDKPTAFTRRAFAIKPARKETLEAFVFAKDAQAKYLRFGVQGGGRRIKGMEKKFDGLAGQAGNYLVPTKNVRTDAQGNVSMATLKRITANTTGPKARYFVGQPDNVKRPYGVYERMPNGYLRALFIKAPQPRYSRRLDLPGIGKRVVQRQFVAQLQQAWAFALKTAK